MNELLESDNGGFRPFPHRRERTVLAVVFVAAMMVAACGDDESGAQAPDAGGDADTMGAGGSSRGSGGRSGSGGRVSGTGATGNGGSAGTGGSSGSGGSADGGAGGSGGAGASGGTGGSLDGDDGGMPDAGTDGSTLGDAADAGPGADRDARPDAVAMNDAATEADGARIDAMVMPDGSTGFVCPLEPLVLEALDGGGDAEAGSAVSEGGAADAFAEAGFGDGGVGDAGVSDSTATDGEAPLETIAIYGCYEDNWGGTHVVGRDAWSSFGDVFHFTVVDNAARFAIAQNDPDNAFNAGLWSRFEWTEHMGDLYFCQVAYDAESEEAALATAPADTSDPTTSGCGGFSWSRLDLP